MNTTEIDVLVIILEANSYIVSILFLLSNTKTALSKMLKIETITNDADLNL